MNMNCIRCFNYIVYCPCKIIINYFLIMYRIPLLFFCLSVYLNSSSQNYCIKNRFSPEVLFTDGQIHKDSNLVYAVAKHWNNSTMDTLKLDLYYPDASVETLNQRPLIVFAFGGGFLGGTRNDMSFFCKEFAKRGYVAATIDYRLGWNCLNLNTAVLCLCNDYISLYNAAYRALEDFNASLRFLSFKSQQYKIDTNNVFVSGGSAGSITALSAAFTSQSEIDAKFSWVHHDYGHIDSTGNQYPRNYKIKGVLDICGALFDTTLMSDNINIPVISFHDSMDCVVNPYHEYLLNCTGNCHNLFAMDGSAIIYSKALKNGTCAELNINPVLGHCASNYNYIINRASCFFKQLFCNTCQSGRFNNESNYAGCDSLGSNTGINQMINHDFISIFPVPASNALNIILRSLERDAYLTISDIHGKQILSEPVSNTQIKISMAIFQNGIYFLTVKSGGNTIREKIVINR